MDAETGIEQRNAQDKNSDEMSHRTKNYCKVISLQIQLPTNDCPETSLLRGDPKYPSSPAKTAATRLNMKQLQLLLREEWKTSANSPKLPVEPPLKPAHRLSGRALACTFGQVRPPWELRGSHPSVQYPNMCLLSRRATSCHSSNDQTFHCVQWRGTRGDSSSEATHSEPQPLSAPSPARFRDGRTTFGSQPELTSASVIVKEDAKLGRKAQSTHLTGCCCRFCATHRSKKQATYLDPLVGGPSGYHRRLTEIAILVSDTIRWEKKKESKRNKQSSSQSA